MTKSTSDSFDSLGAKEMFNQSILYLLHSYRDAGLSTEEAKSKVASDIQGVYNKYVDAGILPPVKKSNMFNPGRTVDSLIETIRRMKTSYRLHKDEQVPFKYEMDGLIRDLQHLKNLIK